MKDYRHILLRDAIRIDRVVNASRLEIDRQYAFEGESHDFWEFQYAALGSAYIYTKNDFYELKQGQITFSARANSTCSTATAGVRRSCGCSPSGALRP